MTLHLVAEEAQLNSVWQDEVLCMLPWMRAVSDICELPEWSRYYAEKIEAKFDSPPLFTILFNGQKRPAIKGKQLPPDPPCLITSLEETLRGGGQPKFPVAVHVNPLSRKLMRLTTALCVSSLKELEEENGRMFQKIFTIRTIFRTFKIFFSKCFFSYLFK